MIISYVSINVRAIETNDDIPNVALNKLTIASNGNSSRAVDGNKTEVIGMVVYIQVNYW